MLLNNVVAPIAALMGWMMWMASPLLLISAACLMLLGLVTWTYTRNVSGPGGAVAQTVTASGNTLVRANPTLNKAYTGSLTTRTSGTAGTLTMSAGHNLTTGCTFDLYWTNTDNSAGKAYGCTAGTVATNSVPFTTAAGDALPVAATAIIANPTVTAPFSVVGNNAQGVALSCSTPGWCVLVDGSNAALLAKYITPTNPFVWATGDAGTAPLNGLTPVAVRMSNLNTNGTSTDMRAEVLVN